MVGASRFERTGSLQSLFAGEQEPEVGEHDLAPLVDAASRGDAGAWEQLYLSLYPRLLAYARRRLDDEQAKDAVAEAMARAVASIGGFSWRGSGFEGWMFTILRHVITDKHRRLGRERRFVPEQVGSDDRDLGAGLIEAEEATAMRAAFARLGAADQELLTLRVVAGLSSEAVAEVLGKRPGAVRMAQARALGRLRTQFEEVSS